MSFILQSNNNVSLKMYISNFKLVGIKIDNEQYGATRILNVEDDGFEMNITVDSNSMNVLEDIRELKKIVDLAISNGFSRFVGTGGENEDVFIFSKEDYFDSDDCLVRNFEASAKIDRIIAESKKQTKRIKE